MQLAGHVAPPEVVVVRLHGLETAGLETEVACMECADVQCNKVIVDGIEKEMKRALVTMKNSSPVVSITSLGMVNRSR